MFGARRGPTLRIPTLLYFAGVPAAWNPGSRSNAIRAEHGETGAASSASETAIGTATLRIESRKLHGCGCPGSTLSPWVGLWAIRQGRHAMPQTKADRSAAAKKAAATRKRNQQRTKSSTAGTKAAGTRQGREAGSALGSAKRAVGSAASSLRSAGESTGRAAKGAGKAASSRARAAKK